MEDMSVTFEVSRPERSMEASEEHPENMLDMLVTLGAFIEEKSTTMSELQSKNIPRISVTTDAFTPDIFTLDSAQAPLNKLVILVTPDKSKFERSMEASEEHP